MQINYEILSKDIVKWLSDYLDKYELESFIIGISGGIDSAVTSTLCARTFKKTIVVELPIFYQFLKIDQSNSINLGKEHINKLKYNYGNVESLCIDLSSPFYTYKAAINTTDLALANTKSRLRMTMLYQIAGAFNGLVVGTGNKVEDFGIGFFTKYGDGGVDISPIGDLTKTKVRGLAKELGILQSIIDAPPTDGLWEDGRTDEDQIGATYEELEWAMKTIEEVRGIFTVSEAKRLSSRQKQVLEIYNRLHKQNLHKMLPIPVFKNANNPK